MTTGGRLRRKRRKRQGKPGEQDCAGRDGQHAADVQSPGGRGPVEGHKHEMDVCRQPVHHCYLQQASTCTHHHARRNSADAASRRQNRDTAVASRCRPQSRARPPLGPWGPARGHQSWPSACAKASTLQGGLGRVFSRPRLRQRRCPHLPAPSKWPRTPPRDQRRSSSLTYSATLTGCSPSELPHRYTHGGDSSSSGSTTG